MNFYFFIIFVFVTVTLTSQQILNSTEWDYIYHANPKFTSNNACTGNCAFYLTRVQTFINVIYICNKQVGNDPWNYDEWIDCIENTHTNGGINFDYYMNLTRILCNVYPTNCSDAYHLSMYISEIALMVYTDNIQYNLGEFSSPFLVNDFFKAVISTCFAPGTDITQWNVCFSTYDNLGYLYGDYIDLLTWQSQIPLICGLYGYKTNLDTCNAFTKLVVNLLVYFGREYVLSTIGTPSYNNQENLFNERTLFNVEFISIVKKFVIPNPICYSNNFSSNAHCLDSFVVYYKRNSGYFQKFLNNGIDTTLSFYLAFQYYQCNTNIFDCLIQSANIIYELISHQCETRFDESRISPLPNISTSEIFLFYSNECYESSTNLIEWARCIFENYDEFGKIFENTVNVTYIIIESTGQCSNCFFESCSGEMYTNTSNCINNYVKTKVSESLFTYYQSNLRIDPVYREYTSFVLFFKTQFDFILNNAIKKALIINDIANCFDIWSAYFINSEYFENNVEILPLQHALNVFNKPSCDKNITACLILIQNAYIDELVRCAFYITDSMIDYPLINSVDINSYIQEELKNISTQTNTLLEWRNKFTQSVQTNNQNLVVYNFTTIFDFADIVVPYCSFQSCTIFSNDVVDEIIDFLLPYNLMSTFILLGTIFNENTNDPTPQRRIVESLYNFYIEIDLINQNVISDISTLFDISARQKYDLFLINNNITSNILRVVNYTPITICNLIDCVSPKKQCVILYSKCIVENIFSSFINAVSLEKNTYINLISSIKYCTANEDFLTYKRCLQDSDYYIKYNPILNLDTYWSFIFNQYIYACSENSYCVNDALKYLDNRRIISNLTLKMTLGANIDYIMSHSIPFITTQPTNAFSTQNVVTTKIVNTPSTNTQTTIQTTKSILLPTTKPTIEPTLQPISTILPSPSPSPPPPPPQTIKPSNKNDSNIHVFVIVITSLLLLILVVAIFNIYITYTSENKID